MPHDPKIIVALDFPTSAEVIAQAEQLEPSLCRVKVGFESFLHGGPALVDALMELGFEVFLDLKFHDIPNTVARACAAAANLGVWMINLHASGGVKMIAAAREAIDAQDHRPHLLAVTVLTSTDQSQHEAMGFTNSIAEQVSTLAATAKAHGADGVVCSALEAPLLRKEHADDFLLVTPGIRPAGTDANDQERVVTPSAAIANGSSYLVIGRPVTNAENPVEVLEQIHVTLS